MNKPKLSLSGIPVIPMHEPMRWEDWLAGRQQRRRTGMRVAPEVIRRESGPNDPRLRDTFDGERGLPFTPTDRL